MLTKAVSSVEGISLRGISVKGASFKGISSVLLALLLAACADEQQVTIDQPMIEETEAERISSPFAYSGYSSPQYNGQGRESVYIPVSDGTRLAATLFFPEDGPEAEFPVLLWYLPGHRESIDPATGELSPYGGKEQIDFFTSYGYVFVLVEMRGSGASFGTRIDRSPQIGLDGKDIVEWLAQQSWSSGEVGMVGSSYQGFSQYATAAHQPDGLRAIFPEIAGFDEYSIMFYPGGIQNVAMSSFASANIARDDQNYYIPAISPDEASADQGPRRAVLPSAPVVDEDGDGELADEIPLDQNNNGTFLDDGEPQYADGNEREDIYYQASLAHVENVNFTGDFVAAAPNRDSTLADTDLTYADLGPADKLAAIADSDIAVYNRAGWFDYHARCATQWFVSLEGHTETKLVVAPTAHGGFAGGFWSHFDVGLNNIDLYTEKLRFFDYHLKGIDNGITEEAPVYIYTFGKGWRAENEWPLSYAENTRWYFNENNTLSLENVAQGSDEYTVDLRSDSRSQGANRWNFRLAGLPDTMKSNSVESRLVYDSEPLTKATEVTGHPIVNILVSSTAADGDFFVYLEDVAPDGTSTIVSDGLLRASFAGLHDEDNIVSGGEFDVQPALPWHGFASTDRNDEIFADGAQVELRIDLMPTSWVFREGHRIRVAIAGADWPTFALHPLLSPENDPDAENNIIPTVTVHRDEAALSYIELPVIPE